MIRYIVTGLVQGIGFRPYIKRLADSLGVTGTVKNSGGIVEIIACAENDAILDSFERGIYAAPLAVIEKIEPEKISDGSFCDFVIVDSADNDVENPYITPDIATCGACVRELFDSGNRRRLHPFISCTKCGPRYSIISSLPYDRGNTAMSRFEMCGECEKEYTDILNVRAHAQTIACRECGPKLSYTVEGDPINEAVKTLRGGGIIAVKNIGGYHFACLASDGAAAARLRGIKKREMKPFAVMFSDMEAVREYAQADREEERILKSDARPIVLLRKKKDFPSSVCGASAYIGAMLPADPIQHILARECGALVMTSANVSGEPIIISNEDMIRLRGDGDFEILSHDREILTPLDDSVCRVICGRAQVIRRARGYVPQPITIGTRGVGALAAGGDLKASFCLGRGGRAYMSQYFGDLADAGAYRAWKENIERLRALTKIQPELIVGDMHPMYVSSAHAKPDIVLQHHFAHMASVMAEHGIHGKTLGFVFDGTGYGTDGCIWGGEVIVWEHGFCRAAHLDYTDIAGGDNAAKDAAALLDCYLISAGLPFASPGGALIKAAIDNHINTVRSSSMGRLFDAVCAMLGICGYNSYEGECAIMLEEAAMTAKKPYPLKLSYKDGVWDVKALIRAVNAAAADGADISEIALGFHHALSEAVCSLARRIGISRVVLSGGVFANRILTELCVAGLKDSGFDVYINERVPTNDGGIALGQLWYIWNK